MANPDIEVGKDIVGAFAGDELVGYFAVSPRSGADDLHKIGLDALLTLRGLSANTAQEELTPRTPPALSGSTAGPASRWRAGGPTTASGSRPLHPGDQRPWRRVEEQRHGGPMRPNVSRLLLALLLLLGVAVLSSCAAGPNDVPAGADPAGFWLGLWHGFITPVTFVVSLFTDEVTIYEVRNNGNWYDFGFVFGLAMIFSGGGGAGAASSRR